MENTKRRIHVGIGISRFSKGRTCTVFHLSGFLTWSVCQSVGSLVGWLVGGWLLIGCGWLLVGYGWLLVGW